MSRRLLAALLLALLGLALPLVESAETAPVLVERVDDRDLVADVGENASAVYSVFNLNARTTFYITATVAAPEAWDASIDVAGDRDAQASRAEFFLVGGDPAVSEPTLVRFALSPEETPRTGATFDITFNIVDTETGAATRVTDRVEVASGAPPRVFGTFANTLPTPADNAYGTFVIELGVWALAGLVALFAGDAIVRYATSRASGTVTREIITKLRKPLFYFVFMFGLSRSLLILPRNPITDFISRVLTAIAVTIFGLYVIYRLLDAGLYYYQQEVAPRTQNTLDDVLVPVLRKMGIVALYIVGSILTLRSLGWDPTILFAGAGIAGLIIAFAAQDTFSNLFSGLFIMLDQPFKEGDEITLETGETARVDNIGLRTTRLYNPRTHESVIVPNNQLATRRIINHYGPDHRFWVAVEVGVSYNANPQQVARILLSIAREHPRIIADEGWEPNVQFRAFAESSVTFLLRAGVAEFSERNQVTSELRFTIKAAFDAEGIEIPYPQRTVWLKQAPPGA